jgi:hypothetical protein
VRYGFYSAGSIDTFCFDGCSEFADIFDLEHFKRVLANDVRIVSSLPSTHLMTRPVEGSPPLHVSPQWIRARYLKRV